MKNNLLLAVSIATFACNDLLLADSSKSGTPDDIEHRIERVVSGLRPETAFIDRYSANAALKERMAFYHTPGVSIAVVNNYKIEWARGFGVKEWGKRLPVTETTLFQAGSISKPIFALAVMRLVQEGRLDLDEDVNRYLVSWKVPPNGSWQPRITLRQLLSHSAGLTVHGFPGYLRTEKLPTVVDILEGRPPSNTPRIEVNILPGTQFRYSGGGMTVAQQLVVDVLSQPFPKIMRDLVLDPLGMTHSTYEQPLSKRLEGSAATAHPSKNHPVEGKWHVYPEMAAAGLWTTPSDLAHAGVELQLALKGESKRILSAERVAQMFKPGIDEAIGIGFFLSGKGGSVRFSHGGWDEGFVAEMTMYKDTGMGAVIMLNSNEGAAMLSEIERSIAREYKWPDYFPKERATVEVPADLLQAFVGEYEAKSGFKCAITKENVKLLFGAAGQPPVELNAESETNFFMTTLNGEITFDRTAKSEVRGLTLQQGGKQISAERKR
jgi:CubicO group peptidase (beta-lactamase class C family)